MNLSTCKFFKEREREREGEKAPRTEKRSLQLSGIDRLGKFQEVLPIPSVGCGQRHQQRRPRSAGQTRGAAGGRLCRGARAQQSLFRPGASHSRPLPHPGLSLLPPPPPLPGPLRRAPRHPRALAGAPPRAHTWSARGKVSPAIATPGSCCSVRGGNLELSHRGDTFSELSPPPGLLRPPSPPFFFFLKHFITHHHPIPIPNPRAPQAPNNNNCKAENKFPQTRRPAACTGGGLGELGRRARTARGLKL